VVGNEFVFSLASGLLPGVLEGVLNMTTGKGFGSVTYADTGEIQTLSYSAFSPPAFSPEPGSPLVWSDAACPVRLGGASMLTGLVTGGERKPAPRAR
jgi:hypothetical protein